MIFRSSGTGLGRYINIRGSGWKFKVYLNIPVGSWTAGSPLRPLPVGVSLGHFALLKLNKSCIIYASWRRDEFNERYCCGRRLKWKVSWPEAEIIEATPRTTKKFNEAKSDSLVTKRLRLFSLWLLISLYFISFAFRSWVSVFDMNASDLNRSYFRK